MEVERDRNSNQPGIAYSWLAQPATATVIRATCETVSGILDEHGLSKSIVLDVVLATDEALCNIMMHAYDEAPDRSRFDLMLTLERAAVQVCLRDYGRRICAQFLPERRVEKLLTGKQIGGYGLFIMNAVMHTVRHRSGQGFNEVLMIKKLDSESTKAQ